MDTHPTMARLYATLGAKVAGPSDLARQLGITPQRVNNWESRGISLEGAVAAQRKWGVSAVWVLHGEHPPGGLTSSQPGRPDFQKMGHAVTVLREYLAVTGDPADWVTDSIMLEVAYEVVLEFGQPVTPSNVIDLTKRLGRRIREGVNNERDKVLRAGASVGQSG